MRILLLKIIFLFLVLFQSGQQLFAQYPPPAGQPGSTAIFCDSSIFVNWAKNCIVTAGYINIADTSVYYAGSNRADYGTPPDALGKADGHVISLGDGGIATLKFDPPVKNGQGFDFAVFENGLNDSFLELGFVEVSSDSIRFVRFPTVSLTKAAEQIPTFGTLDATKINNLAGKYRVFFGTPFDLDELIDSTGIDLNKISFIRIIDVVGTIDPVYAMHDSRGNIINDPWPTPFNTGGFDLDAIGVIHEKPNSENSNFTHPEIGLFPNPVVGQLTVLIPTGYPVSMKIITEEGIDTGISATIKYSLKIDLSGLKPGIYLGSFRFNDGIVVIRKIVKL